MGHRTKKSPPKQWVALADSCFTEYHERLGWFNAPNKNVLLETANFSTPLRTNSIGLRGSREYPPAKPAGITRICAIGDSFTFGYGVGDNDSFPAQMETLSPSLEVMNFGVPGFGVDQMYLISWNTAFFSGFFTPATFSASFQKPTRD